VQQQEVVLASELKSVLNSCAVHESKQAELAKTVIEKVLSLIKDEKTQNDILASVLAEVVCRLVLLQALG
jgi:F-type H+-transporting ATPase subunit b